MATELFLLFPMYKEDDTHQPHYLSRYDLMDDTELNDYIRKISDMNSFFHHETFQGYYDSLNVVAFAYPLEAMEDCYPGKKTYLRTVLKEWENWRDDSSQCNEDKFLFHTFSLSDDTLCEVAKRKRVTPDYSFLLINHQAFRCSEPEIVVSCNSEKMTIQVCPIAIKEIAEWLSQYRKPQRNYSWSSKHGEFGKGAHPSHRGDEVSTLLGSRGEAEELLKKAIGLQPQGTLFYYDTKYQQYMEFKMESANTYHSFHIENENRIPPILKVRIKEVL